MHLFHIQLYNIFPITGICYCVQAVQMLDGTAPSVGHTVLDLGDDAFTVGKPHPMIEPSLR